MTQKSIKVAVKEFAIVKSIMAALKLDEAGKISKFFTKLVKEDERAIAQLEANKKAEKLQYDMNLSDLQDKLEDAEDALEAVYLNVAPENVATNADMDSFSTTYRRNLVDAQSTVDYYSKEIEKLEEIYTKSIEEADEQIAKRKAFIDKISK